MWLNLAIRYKVTDMENHFVNPLINVKNYLLYSAWDTLLDPFLNPIVCSMRKRGKFARKLLQNCQTLVSLFTGKLLWQNSPPNPLIRRRRTLCFAPVRNGIMAQNLAISPEKCTPPSNPRKHKKHDWCCWSFAGIWMTNKALELPLLSDLDM